MLHQITFPDRIRLCLTKVCSSALALFLALSDQSCAFCAVGIEPVHCGRSRAGLLVRRDRWVGWLSLRQRMAAAREASESRLPAELLLVAAQVACPIHLAVFSTIVL